MSVEGNASQPARGGSERRTEPRHTSTQRLTCYPVGSGFGDRRQARVRNVSRSGLALIVDRHWPPGTVIVVELPGVEGARIVRGKVVHATMQAGGSYLVGCALESPLGDAEVQALAQ